MSPSIHTIWVGTLYMTSTIEGAGGSLKAEKTCLSSRMTNGRLKKVAGFIKINFPRVSRQLRSRSFVVTTPSAEGCRSFTPADSSCRHQQARQRQPSSSSEGEGTPAEHVSQAHHNPESTLLIHTLVLSPLT